MLPPAGGRWRRGTRLSWTRVVVPDENLCLFCRDHEEELGEQQQRISGESRERSDLRPRTQLHGELLTSPTPEVAARPLTSDLCVAVKLRPAGTIRTRLTAAGCFDTSALYLASAG